MKSQVNLPDDKIESTSQLAQVATDLTDEEVGRVGAIVKQVQRKYAGRANTVKNLEELRDEILTRLAEINILATLDPSPVFYGEPPTLEIIGHVAAPNEGSFDHEKKQHEVLKANELNEDYRGQKESYNKRRLKKG
jgi:hypothetical protein